MSFELIQSITLETDVPGVVFTNIPQDGTDLMIITSFQAPGTGLQDIGFKFNNTSTSQTSTRLEGNGSSVTVGNRTSEVRGNNEITFEGSPSTPNFGNAIIYINDYSGSGHKAIDFFSGGETGATTAHINVLAGRWGSTSALTEISVQRDTGTTNLKAGSSASLYKITKP